MNSRWTRFIIVVLSLFVITVFIGQAFFAGGERLSLETAYRYDIDVEIPFEGVYMRDETPIYDFGTGVLSYECSDGSKVGKSTVIARRYKSESDVANRREIEKIRAKIDVLTGAEKLVGTDSSQMDAITAQINESHSALISSILDGDFDAADREKDNLLEAMCKREISLNESDGYASRKQQLNSEIASLNAMLHGEVVDVVAGSAGYFVSEVDGYEDEIGFSDVALMTKDKISEIVSTPKKGGSGGAVGKLIADYRWRVAAVISTEKLFGIFEGSTVTLRVGSSSQLLTAEVVSMKPCGDNEAVYVFECDKLNSAVASGRTAKFKVVVSSYNGLRVPRKALRYNEEGEQGVYIKLGQRLVFKNVNVEYWGEDYVICSQKTGDKYLMLYDEIVTEGKDLYDGKVIG